MVFAPTGSMTLTALLQIMIQLTGPSQDIGVIADGDSSSTCGEEGSAKIEELHPEDTVLYAKDLAELLLRDSCDGLKIGEIRDIPKQDFGSFYIDEIKVIQTPEGCAHEHFKVFLKEALPKCPDGFSDHMIFSFYKPFEIVSKNFPKRAGNGWIQEKRTYVFPTLETTVEVTKLQQRFYLDCPDCRCKIIPPEAKTVKKTYAGDSSLTKKHRSTNTSYKTLIEHFLENALRSFPNPLCHEQHKDWYYLIPESSGPYHPLCNNDPLDRENKWGRVYSFEFIIPRGFPLFNSPTEIDLCYAHFERSPEIDTVPLFIETMPQRPR